MIIPVLILTSCNSFLLELPDDWAQEKKLCRLLQVIPLWQNRWKVNKDKTTKQKSQRYSINIYIVDRTWLIMIRSYCIYHHHHHHHHHHCYHHHHYYGLWWRFRIWKDKICIYPYLTAQVWTVYSLVSNPVPRLKTWMQPWLLPSKKIKQGKQWNFFITILFYFEFWNHENFVSLFHILAFGVKMLLETSKVFTIYHWMLSFFSLKCVIHR